MELNYDFFFSFLDNEKWITRQIEENMFVLEKLVHVQQELYCFKNQKEYFHCNHILLYSTINQNTSF